MSKPPEDAEKEPKKVITITPQHRKDQSEKALSRLSGTATKVASWAVASAIKQFLPDGYDPNLRAAAYFPAYQAAFLSAYISLSKNEVDLDTARFEAQASARGAVQAVTDPVLHPEAAPIKLF